MTTRTRSPLACVLATLAAGALIAATAVLPQRAWAQDSNTQTAPQAEATAAGGSWCSGIPPGYGHPPANLTPLALQITQPSVEPVPATDGLIHLVYAAQATNTQATPADITSVVPVDPLAGFSPTGRNFVTDDDGRDVTGKVRLFAMSGDAPPVDGPEVEPPPAFSTLVPAGNSGLMFFDVTYTDPAQIPRLLSHAITLAPPNGGPGVTGLTNPVPVGCQPLAVLRPPLVGDGWTAANGCCAAITPHRGAVLPVNGVLQPGQQFAIDYIQLGPNGACCNGPVQALSSWWGYDTPILAAATGVVADVMDGLPDQDPVGTVTNVTIANLTGNSVIEAIGGGRFVAYAHLKPGTIPVWVRKGAFLKAGDLIGRLGNSGNSTAPHLHFQAMNGPSILDASGLPFVFETQQLEGRVPEGALDELVQGVPLIIDRTGDGVRLNQMPAGNQVFGYNLSQ